MDKSIRSDKRLLVASGLGVCLLAGGARGDVKVVSSVTVTHSAPAAQTTPTITFQPGGTPNQTTGAATPTSPSIPAPETVTTYFKGGNARTEVAGGPVTLYNGAEEKVYTLDPTQKTYFVRSVKDIQQPPPDPATGGSAAMKVNADLSLSPGDGAKTFAGVPSKVFILSGTVVVSPERSGGSRGGGGFGGGGRHHRGGGGFPGGGGGGYPSGGDEGGGTPGGGVRGRSRVVEVSGEYWLSDTLKVPDDRKATLLPAFLMDDPGQAFVFKSLADNLGKKKEIPLDSRITLTYTAPQGGQETVTTTTEVTSVSQTALPDALFQLPTGYTQVAPPPV
jgi:hypothetical protein